MAGDSILIGLILVPFLAGLAVWLYMAGGKGQKGGKKEAAAMMWAAVIPVAELIFFAALLVEMGGIFTGVSQPVPLAGQDGYRLELVWEGFCGLGLHLCLDGFRVVYCLIASFMWACALLFSREYMQREHGQAKYALFTLFTYGATVGVFLSADLYSAFIFFEIMSFTSYTWVAHEETKEALRAAETYLAVAVVGGLVMLMGLFLLYRELGTLEISALQQAAEGKQDKLLAAAVCILFGYGAKAGVFPLHIWLPKAHPAAPSPASALLSGILTKAGMFGILVLSCQLMYGNEGWGALLLVLGVVTMFLGALLALFSDNLKRTLACSSVSQIGFILVGVGMQGLLAGSIAPASAASSMEAAHGAQEAMHGAALAIQGSFLHMVNHSLIKLVLFLAAGVVFMNLHELNLNRIRGFGRGKRLLQVCFLMGALGIGGVPLWNGYVSKTLLHEGIVEYRALLAEGVLPGASFLTGAAWMGLVEWVFLISGGLTVAYMLKLYLCLFVEKNNDPAKQAEYDGMRHYMNPVSRLALSAGAVLLPVLGLFPHQTGERLAQLSSIFLHLGADSAGMEEGAVLSAAYFSLESLKGAAISIVIGVLVYLAVVRVLLMRREEGRTVYVNRWPAWLDLEELVYRPVLLNIFPVLCGSLCRIGDRLVDTLVVACRKTLYRDSKIPHELEEGNFVTHIIGSTLDGITDYFNHPDATEEEKREEEYTKAHLSGKYEHKLAMMNNDFRENSIIIGRSLSFGLFLACLGLLFTLIYMLVE